MSLTGGKREFEVLSSDSEYLEESSVPEHRGFILLKVCNIETIKR